MLGRLNGVQISVTKDSNLHLTILKDCKEEIIVMEKFIINTVKCIYCILDRKSGREKLEVYYPQIDRSSYVSGGRKLYVAFMGTIFVRLYHWSTQK